MEEQESLCTKDRRRELNKPKIVVCEGIEEERFFPRLLKHCNALTLSQDLLFLNCGGKSNLESYLKNITGFTGYPQVTSIGIVIDSQGNPEGIQPSFQKAQNALRLIDFAVPSEMGKPIDSNGKRAIIWIMPDNQSIGELEDLCLKALEHHSLIDCAQQVENCIKERQQMASKVAKSRLYTILAWQDPPGRRLAELTDSEILGWDLQVFDPLVTSFFSQL